MIGYYIDYVRKRKTIAMRVENYIDGYYSQLGYDRVNKEQYLICEFEEVE